MYSRITFYVYAKNDQVNGGGRPPSPESATAPINSILYGVSAIFAVTQDVMACNRRTGASWWSLVSIVPSNQSSVLRHFTALIGVAALHSAGRSAVTSVGHHGSTSDNVGYFSNLWVVTVWGKRTNGGICVRIHVFACTSVLWSCYRH